MRKVYHTSIINISLLLLPQERKMITNEKKKMIRKRRSRGLPPCWKLKVPVHLRDSLKTLSSSTSSTDSEGTDYEQTDYC